MKFQEAVEKLVSDPRAEAIGREIWDMPSIVCGTDQLYFTDFGYNPNPAINNMRSIVCGTDQLYFISTDFVYNPTVNDVLADDWHIMYKDNKSTPQLEVEVAFKLASSCTYESFVGGPGDYSPPDCKCDKCIAANRVFKFTTGTHKIDSTIFEYLWDLLAPLDNTKRRRFGLEYSEYAKCRITLQPRMNILCVEANKPEIRIGEYIFNLETKTFSK